MVRDEGLEKWIALEERVRVGVIIFSSVWFLSKKVTNPKYFFKKKPKPAQTDWFRFGSLGQKPVQTGLARFFSLTQFWLSFFPISIWVCFGLIFLVSGL
jgi:hypothetical protein